MHLPNHSTLFMKRILIFFLAVLAWGAGWAQNPVIQKVTLQQIDPHSAKPTDPKIFRWGSSVTFQVSNIKAWNKELSVPGTSKRLALFADLKPVLDAKLTIYQVDTARDTALITFEAPSEGPTEDGVREGVGSTRPVLDLLLKDLDRPLSLSLGFKDGAPLGYPSKTQPVKAWLVNYHGELTWLALVVDLLIFFLLVWLVYRYDALRNPMTPLIKKPSYSLSRTQLFLWTIVVLCCVVGTWIVGGQIMNLNETVLILLGISVSTTAGATMIDSFKREEDDPSESEIFLKDIISDSKGAVNVHRLQAVAWNLVFMVYFIVQVWNQMSFPHLDSQWLILMGISNAAYLSLKPSEGSTPAPKTASTNSSTTTPTDAEGKAEKDREGQDRNANAGEK